MKIAFLCHDIFSEGGVQRVVTNIANMLSKENYVDIICVGNNIEIDRDKYGLYNNIKVLKCKYKERSKINYIFNKMFRGLNKYLGLFNYSYLSDIQFKIYHSRNLVNEVQRILLKNNYDVVIGCEGFFTIILGYIGKSLKCKTIGWQHSSYDAYFNGDIPYYKNREKMFSKYLNKLDVNVVLTEYDRNLYAENLSVHCKVINNPISFESNKIKSFNNKIIMSAGRLVYQKGFDILIDAFTKFKEEDLDEWKLKIFGDGYEEKNIRNKIKELKMDKYIELMPFTKNIEEEMCNSDIFALTSRNEGFGLVVVEALECGLPVISFDNSGPNEILNGYECGILVEKNNIEMLVEAFRKLTSSEKLVKTLHENAKRRAKDFSKDIILNQWIKILK